MLFDLSKPQKLLKESARTFFQRECPIRRARELMETDTGFDETLWSGMVDQGWIGLTLPEKYEGLGLGIVELAALCEEMGRTCVPSPFLATTWAATLIAESGNETLQARCLKSISEGNSKATVALIEPDASWDPADVRNSLEKIESGFQFKGSRAFVLDAAVADSILCVVRTGGSLVIAVVPSDRTGVTVSPTPGIDQTRKLHRIDFKNINITPEEILAEGEIAENALQRSMQIGAVMACAELVGVMQWMLESTVEYAKTRQQFGNPIGAFQAVQNQCADMLLMVESARSVTYYAAWALTEKHPAARRAVSMAKAYCSDAGRDVGNRGVQVHGGIGFTWEHDMHLFYKRAKANELLFGDATFHRERIARLLLD